MSANQARVYYLDAGPLQWLIETGQFEQFKAQAAAQGIDLRTTDVVLAELEGRGKTFTPSKEVQAFLDQIGKDPQIEVDLDPHAPRANNLPDGELIIPLQNNAGENGINTLARNAIDNGVDVKIITHDSRYLRGIGEDLLRDGKTASIGDLNLNRGDSTFPKNPSILEEIFPDDAVGQAEFRDGLRDPRNPKAPFPDQPGRLDFKSNEELGVRQFDRIRSDGSVETRTRPIANGPPDGEGWVDRDTGRNMNDDATEARDRADERIRDKVRDVIDDPNSYDSNGDMKSGAKNTLNNIIKGAGPLGWALDLDDALETGKKARERYKNGDFEGGDRELAGLAGRLNGGLLGARLGAAFGLYGAIAGGILGALVGDRALRQISDWIPGTFGELIARRDPLIVDLSPSLTGVELERLDDVNVSFDLDGDGFRELTGWTGANSGFVVLDHNGNGQIDDGGELFGNLQQNGFEALSAYDSNADGVFDASDSAFQTVQVWHDANQNGLTEAGELLSLADAGIASIDLGATVHSGRLQSGHEILASSTYITTDGAQAEAVAVDFSTDQVNTLFVLPDGFEFDPEVFELPNLRGYGEVPDLWVAMTLDPDLKAMVQQFMQNLPADLDEMIGQAVFESYPAVGQDPIAFWDYDLTEFETIILRWSGYDTDTLEESITSPYSLAIQDAAESFLNRQIEDRFRLNLADAIRLENADYFDPYKEFFSELAVRFMAQWAAIEENRPGVDLLQDMIAARDVNGDIPTAVLTSLVDQAVDGSVVERTLPAILAQYSLLEHDLRTDSIGGDIEGFLDLELANWAFDSTDPWAGYDEWEGVAWGAPTRRDLLKVIDPDGSILDFRRRAYTQNNTLPVLRESDFAFVTGTSGSDTLVGEVSADRPSFFSGGAGDDIIQGRAANDTFAFAHGFGSDELSDEGGTDEIAFQGELASTEVSVRLVSGSRTDVVFEFDGRTDALTVRDFFDANGRARFEKVTFADGATLSAYDIRSEVLADLATIDSDIVQGFNVDQRLRGFAGNDDLTGGDGHDTFIGGSGHDVLRGGDNADTYIYAHGDGDDTIHETINGSTGDTLRLSGVDPSSISLARNSSTAILVVAESVAGAGNGGSITLTDSFDGNFAKGVERIEFDDGTVWNQFDLRIRHLAEVSTAGDDVIVGFRYSDLIEAGLGDDDVSGGDGADTYVYNRGDGHDTFRDTINGSTGDRLLLRGVQEGDIALVRTGGNAILVIGESTPGAGDSGSILLTESLNSKHARGIEFIEFEDGTVWTQGTLRLRHLADQSTDGADVIVGFDTADTIEAGLGDDDLSGGDGTDTYIYSRGDGDDIIREAINGSTGDRLVLHGVDPSAVSVERLGGTATLVIAESSPGAGDGSRISLTESFNSKHAKGVEFIEFDDGTVWTQATLREAHLADAATDGDDAIVGFDTPDTIEAGLGNDDLRGSDGADTYVYSRGDGDDVITEVINGSTTDRLVFTDVLQSEVTYEWSGNDITVVVAESAPGAGDGGRITLTDNLDERYGNGVDSIVFADQSVVSQGDVRRNVTASSATDGDDTITGTGASETLYGGLGDDYLYGDKGNDTYLYKRGDGNDTIEERNNHSSGDQLILEDIDPASVSLSRSGDHAVLTVAESAPGAGDGGQLTLYNTLNGKYAGGINSIVFDDGTVWSQGDLRTRYLSESSTDGDDNITGFRYNDTIEAGLGDDYIFGGDGNDTYIYNRGDGVDTIREDNNSSSGDILQLRGIATTDVNVGRSGDHAVLTITESALGAGDGGQLTLQNTINGRYAGGINSIQFDDGTTWSQSFLRSQYLIDAVTDGDDTITGFGGSETLTGGLGNDILTGWSGNDTYVFNLGYGNDIIRDFWSSGSGGSDKVLFGEGIAAADLTVTAPNGGDLLLSIAGTTDGVLLDNTLNNSDYRIESVEFSDGTVLSHADLVALAATPTGGDDLFYGSYDGETIDGGEGNDTVYAGSGNDTLVGGVGTDRLEGQNGNDTIIGGLGDDTLLGGDGDDLYLYARGDGNDGLFDYRRQETDTLRFTDISRNEVIFYSSGNDLYAKVLDSSEGAGDGSLIRLYRSTRTNSEGVDRFEFSDGVVISDDTVMTQRFVMGTAGNDTLVGGTGNSNLFGDYGDDELTGGLGNDILNGSFGSDTAVYFGNSDEFSIITENGQFQLRDDETTIGDNEGTDTLIGIETLRFGDGSTVGITSPIILDLDGDGVETLSAAESASNFDLNGDGLGDDTSWVGADDGFLFIDRDGDGTVSGAGEISFISDVSNAATDLAGIAGFDSNGDGILNDQDQDFASFGVWQDANGDGVVDLGETKSLASAGIAAINLAGTAVEAAFNFGEVAIANTGTFMLADGSERSFADSALTFTPGKASQTKAETYTVRTPIDQNLSHNLKESMDLELSLEELMEMIQVDDPKGVSDLFDRLESDVSEELRGRATAFASQMVSQRLARHNQQLDVSTLSRLQDRNESVVGTEADAELARKLMMIRQDVSMFGAGAAMEAKRLSSDMPDFLQFYA